ncbi:unnamed protein product, partial [Dicrocoelium dendriticum]
MRIKASGLRCEISVVDTVQVAWDKLKTYLTEVSTPCIPLARRKETRTRSPWIDTTGKYLLQKRSRCWRAYRAAPSISTYDRYREARNRCKQHLRKARLLYEEELAGEASENQKKFFAYVMRRCGSNSVIPTLMRADGTRAYADSDKARVLGEQYAGAFVREAALTSVELAPRVPEGSYLAEFTVVETQVLKLLQELNPSKAAGPDSVHPKLLHELAVELSGSLTMVFQKSLDICTLPSEWKEAVICTIFKSDDRSLSANYRPVSLTSVVVKLLENLVRDSLQGHLNRFDLLSTAQHGFRKGFSCLTNLLVARE